MLRSETAVKKAEAIVLALKARHGIRRQPTISEMYDDVTMMIIADALDEYTSEREKFLEGRHQATVQQIRKQHDAKVVELYRTIDDLQSKLAVQMRSSAPPEVTELGAKGFTGVFGVPGVPCALIVEQGEKAVGILARDEQAIVVSDGPKAVREVMGQLIAMDKGAEAASAYVVPAEGAFPC